MGYIGRISCRIDRAKNDRSCDCTAESRQTSVQSPELQIVVDLNHTLLRTSPEQEGRAPAKDLHISIDAVAEQNIFSGLIYCMDCGGTLVLHRAHTMDAVKNNFMCNVYKRKGKEACTSHYIRERELSAILLDDIRRITHFVRQNELRFAEHIRKKQSKEAQQEITALQKKIDTMRKRQNELTRLFKRLYEDNVLGGIPDEQYRILSQEYTMERDGIQEQLPVMETKLQELKDATANIARFIENAKRYNEIPALTSEILHTFIKRVEVGERSKRYSHTATQEIRIYYRDIGLVDDLPESMIDAADKEVPNDEVA